MIPRGKPKDYDWSKTRVWWSAKHKWSGQVHLAASLGGGRITRCGLRIYQNGKQFRLYEWTRHGRSPIAPTCGQCIRLHKGDVEGHPDPFPERRSNGIAND